MFKGEKISLISSLFEWSKQTFKHSTFNEGRINNDSHHLSIISQLMQPDLLYQPQKFRIHLKTMTLHHLGDD